MARIQINDLPEEKEIGTEELKAVFGGVNVRNLYSSHLRLKSGLQVKGIHRSPDSRRDPIAGIVRPNC